MTVNRRRFMVTVAGAFMSDPDRLLWRQGERLISIPKPATVRMCGHDYFSIDWPGSRDEWSFGMYVSEMIAANRRAFLTVPVRDNLPMVTDNLA